MNGRLAKCSLAMIVIASAAACSSPAPSADETSIPQSADDYAGQPYEDVVSELQAAGFSDVSAEPLGDLITGWLNPEGSVDMVEVAGDSDFDAAELFPRDVEIIVSYHSFPVDEQQSSAPSPTATEVSPSPTPEEDTPVETQEPVLDAASNADLATLLSASDTDSAFFEEFTANYRGQLIEFDGHIAAMAPHGDYTTRYDILIYAGHVATSTLSGPSFQFRDVNTSYDLHLVDEATESVAVNDDLRIVARVEGYEPRSGLFLLTPVTTQVQ